jgi:hypothetical protein
LVAELDRAIETAVTKIQEAQADAAAFAGDEGKGCRKALEYALRQLQPLIIKQVDFRKWAESVAPQLGVEITVQARASLRSLVAGRTEVVHV